MTPLQAVALLTLLTQEETADLLTACVEFLPVDRVESALRAGLDELERRQLAFQLSIEFERE